MRNCLFLCLIALLAMPASLSWAQFSSGNTPSSEPVAPVVSSVSHIGFGQNNPQVKRLLELQDQNQLLKKLIERETSVNQMIEAAIGVGISSPFVPAPDKNLCQAVPANIPCAQAYTSLYENYSTSPKPVQVAMPAANSIMEDTDIPALNARDLSALPEPVLATAEIFWTDITCLGMKCSAVISPDPADPKARYRIVTGEKLPDGSIVQAISATGVTIKRDNKAIALDPAPAANT